MGLLRSAGLKEKKCSNAIIITFRGVIVGVTITAIDYYLYAKSKGIDVHLVLVDSSNSNRSVLIDFILDRYLVDESVLSGIKTMPHNALMFGNYKTALIHYCNYESLKQYLITCEKVVCLGSYGSQGVSVSMPDNFLFLPEPEYTKKMLLQAIRSRETFENTYFLHIGSKLREGRADAPYIIEKLSNLRVGRVICYINPYDTWNRDILDKYMEVWTTPIPGLFCRFGTYIYIHTGFFDYSPRMFIESSYLGKNILYINEFGVDDGCEQRYLDHLDSNYDRYMFTEEDLVMRYLYA